MKTKTFLNAFLRRPIGVLCLSGALSVLGMGVAQAQAPAEETGLFDFLAGAGDAQPFKGAGIKWGGWINGSITHNFNEPDDNFNGPVTFGDRHNEGQLNQFYLWLQRAVTASGSKWDVGGRFDFMLGTDAIFTQGYGVPAQDLRSLDPLNRGDWDLFLLDDNRFYGIALPQAFLEINVPIGTGLSVKVGHFYTPIGYEVVTAPDNFFFTKPYTFQYGEPFTHTGILGSYTFNDNWSAMLGAVTASATGGWDGNFFNTQIENWDALAGATWTSTDKNYSVGITGTAGPRSEDFGDLWAIYSIVAKANFLNNTLHYIFQHDHGFADNVLTARGVRDARWYGINQYLLYDINDKVSVGLRGEWFRDEDGFRVLGPARCGAGFNVEGTNPDGSLNTSNYACPNNATVIGADNYYEVTVGMTYKPVKWVSLRPNLRYDWTDKIRAFDTGTSTDQFIMSGDVLVVF
jgi:hypothetical protein